MRGQRKSFCLHVHVHVYLQCTYAWGNAYSLLNTRSIQHSTTYVKKIIEDNNPVEDTVRFLGVRIGCSLATFNLFPSLLVVLQLGKLGLLSDYCSRVTS